MVGGYTGAYGSIPLPVLAAAQKLSMTIEEKPDDFIKTSYMPRLLDVRQKLALMIDECVLVPNASMGINIVLWNFTWEEGDIIVTRKLSP